MTQTFKQIIIVRADIRLGKGKLAAQVAHASLNAYKKTLKKCPDLVKKWESLNQPKIVLKVASEEQLLELYNKIKKKFPAVLIKDAGLTQLKEPTITCIGVGPIKSKDIDMITGNLKLL